MKQREEMGRVVVTIQHPAHVHVFKHPISELERRGYDVHVFARKRPLVSFLLDKYGIDHEILAGEGTSLARLAAVQCRYELRLFDRIRTLEPAVAISIGEPAIAHASAIFDCQSVVLTDTEHAFVQNSLTFPFADTICTPDSFSNDLGRKQVRYPGYHEMAYLHPDRFTPDSAVASHIDHYSDGPLIVLRLVSWKAAHDVGQEGIIQVEQLVEKLERNGATVVITAEMPLPTPLDDRQITVPPHAVHDLLYHADLFIGESATMAIESSVLGTPALYISSLTAGVLEELETTYGLLLRLPERSSTDTVSTQAQSMIDEPSATWKNRRKRLLADKIDTTSFVVKTVMEATSA